MTQTENNMTEKTQEELDAESAEFVAAVRSNFPAEMGAEHVLALCASLITAYASEEAVAKKWSMALARMLATIYAEISAHSGRNIN